MQHSIVSEETKEWPKVVLNLSSYSNVRQDVLNWIASYESTGKYNIKVYNRNIQWYFEHKADAVLFTLKFK